MFLDLTLAIDMHDPVVGKASQQLLGLARGVIETAQLERGLDAPGRRDAVGAHASPIARRCGNISSYTPPSLA